MSVLAYLCLHISAWVRAFKHALKSTNPPCQHKQPMKLLPCDTSKGSCWDDPDWQDRPGYPPLDGCWIHPPCAPSHLPEVYFCENHHKTQDEPPPSIYLGSGHDSHVRLDSQFPGRLCRMAEATKTWSLEALTPRWQVHVQEARGGTWETLDVGRPRALQHGDTICLTTPPAAWASYSFLAESEEPPATETKCPNRYPARFPCRSSLPEAPEAPEELRRLAWQTDQMRRRSEQDQVRVADWSNFSQYVKQHYLNHGIHCTSWKQSRGRPCDPKPESFAARQLPPWICDLLVSETPLKGLRREMPFESCLAASGCYLPALSSQPTKPSQTSQISQALPASQLWGQGENRALEARSEAPPSQTVESVCEDNPLLLQPIHDWLESVDDSGFLLQYYDQIVANFDSLKQIHDVYFHSGSLDSQFFVAAGISKLGHKRILQKWFKDHFV